MGLTRVNARGTLVHMSESIVPIEENALAVIPKCTEDEATFALAVVESNGNIAAAFRMAFGPDASQFPLARGKEFLCRPQVALKIKELTDTIQDASLISIGAHLHELADIRDLAKATGQLKTALAAERHRGEAVGIYQRHDPAAKGRSSGAVNIQINMASAHDVTI